MNSFLAECRPRAQDARSVPTRVARLSIAVVVVLAVAACGGGSRAHRDFERHGKAVSTGSAVAGRGAVAFIAGLSTDPDGSSHPIGLGVATKLTSGRLHVVRKAFRGGPYSVDWLSAGRLVVQSNYGVKGRPAALVAAHLDGLTALPVPPLRAGDSAFAWSPDRQLIATEPSKVVSCGPGAVVTGCTTAGHEVFVQRADGSDRRRIAHGLLAGWTPDGQILTFSGDGAQFSAGVFATVGLSSGRRQSVLSSRTVARYAHVDRAELGGLAYSGDGHYLALMASFAGVSGHRQLPLGKERAIVIARSDGAILRVIVSPDVISMLAWSPTGHRLAYTTSGFPAPHELFLLDHPLATPWRILSQAPHFDWVTWSPDAHWLLVDNQNVGSWNLLHLVGHRSARAFGGASVPLRRLPRLGGQPVWCCPENHSAGS